jgi:hypothetical protein
MSPNLLSRTRDAGFLNEVANDDAVRPWLGGEGALDLTGTVGNDANVALINRHGGFVFICHDATRYELHTLFRPEGRGAGVLPAAEEAFRWLFVNTDCAEIMTKVPAGNRAADLMARRAGFTPIFTREAAWADGSAVTYFAMTFDAWRARDGALAAAGHDFHTLIETAKAAAGSALPTHPDDEVHDRAAGAAVLMALAGNAEKAVWLYNRWARFAGYQTIDLVSALPVVIDVRDALVTVQGEKLEVLQCR